MKALRSSVLSLLAGSLLLVLFASPAGARQPHFRSLVSGTWSNPVGACVAHIVKFDPATGDITCTGTSAWTGTWTGSTTWKVTGNQDLATGAGSGRIDEVFTGHAADGRSGTLTFVENFTLDAAGNIDIHGRIVSSSGELARSHGRARWVGTSSATTGSGSGTYSGRWHQARHRCHKKASRLSH